MPQGLGEGSKATQFTGNEPRCRYGHSNCPAGENCVNAGDSGRPTKWKPEYNDMIVEWFNVEPYREVNDKLIPNKPPTFFGFAAKIGVDQDTIAEWAKPENAKNYPGFFGAYWTAKQKHQDLVMQGAMTGAYSGQFSQFYAKNVFGMKDKTETDITSKGESVVGFNYVVPKNPNEHNTDDQTSVEAAPGVGGTE